MAPLAGSVLAAAALLVVAGVAKGRDPAATRVALRVAGLPAGAVVARLVGAAEVVIGVAALTVGGPVAAAGVAAAHLGFAGFSHRLHRASRGRAGCGCFGRASAPVTRLHVWVNVAVAVAVASTLADPVGGVADVVRHSPWSGGPLLALAVLQAWMVAVTLTVLPQVQAAVHARPPRAGRTAPIARSAGSTGVAAS